jgi:hypothetical protein
MSATTTVAAGSGTATTDSQQGQGQAPSSDAGSAADDWKSIYTSWVEIVSEIEDVDSVLNYTEQEVAHVPHHSITYQISNTITLFFLTLTLFNRQ